MKMELGCGKSCTHNLQPIKLRGLFSRRALRNFMHSHLMVSMFALATLLPLPTLATQRQTSSASTVANKTEIIGYVFPRGRVLGPR